MQTALLYLTRRLRIGPPVRPRADWNHGTGTSVSYPSCCRKPQEEREIYESLGSTEPRMQELHSREPDDSKL